MTNEFEVETTTRKSRESESHAKQPRRTPWRPVRKLETPPAPEGYEYRWIRESMMGQEDRANVSRRLREGWELVRAEELNGFEIPTLDDGRHSGVVSVGGLLLAKIPTETRNERNAYFSNRAQLQQDAIDHDLMQESDPSSPILKPERKTSVTFGGGNRE